MRALSRTGAAALIPLLFGTAALAEGYTFTTGAEYTRGDYGTDIDTGSWYVPFSLGYSAERFAWSVTVPYIRVDGSSLVSGVRSTTLGGRGGGPGQSVTTTTDVERVDAGLGDVTLSGSYLLQQETPARPWLGLTGKVKLGTADEEKNLGTGENDYAIQLEAAKGPLDGLIGYNLLGDTATTDYDDILYAAAAFSLPLQRQWRVRSELYAEQSPLAGVDPVRELTVTFSRPLSRDRQLSLYAIKGFSDSSPEWGMGALISSGF
jgi:hypothetical protein